MPVANVLITLRVMSTTVIPTEWLQVFLASHVVPVAGPFTGVYAGFAGTYKSTICCSLLSGPFTGLFHPESTLTPRDRESFKSVRTDYRAYCLNSPDRSPVNGTDSTQKRE
jgi:hypothetical protein